MKILIKTIIIIFMNIIIIYPVFGHPHYVRYKNTKFNYTIIIPKDWGRSNLNLSAKHIMYVTQKYNTEIKIQAFKSREEDIEKMVNKTLWDLRKVDPGLNKIIETENINIRNNVKGKFMVFEYTSHRSRLLHRILVTKNNDIVYIVECKSPKGIFYKSDDIFTTALSSFNFIDSSGDEELEPEVKKDSDEKSLKEKTDDEDKNLPSLDDDF